MKCNELMRLLKQNGWVIVSQKGSHIKMKHAEKPRIIIVPDHGAKELATGTLQRIAKDTGVKLKGK